MNPEDEVEMEIFRTGDYGAKGAYTPGDLQQIVDDYKPELLEAPLTFDHAQSGPAYGWVSRLRREGDRLIAMLKGVPQAVRDMVNAGAYKRRSVELFRIMPQTGRPYLRAVSLLGAATPEVKGLREIRFGASDEAERVEFTRSSSGTDLKESVASPVHPQFGDEVSALRSRLLENRIALMFSELRADGYCLAERDAEGIRHIFAENQALVKFDDEAADSTLNWMADFLRQHLLRAPLGEAAAARSSSRQSTPPQVQFSERTDPRSLELHHNAIRLQAEIPGMPYRDALSRASRGA